ncbi:MAG: hypothetical protein IPG96_10995 [Proteobacteria bacterium]|nr:hypothetical protein [Pseudomonadota bacterium]
MARFPAPSLPNPTTGRWLVVLALVGTTMLGMMLGARGAAADGWDLNLSRLCFFHTRDGATLPCGGSYDFSQHGGLGTNGVEPDNESFRSLMSELGVVFAPDTTAPAQTLGFGGFHLGIDFGFTSINRNRRSNLADPAKRHWYWRAAESVSSAALAAYAADPTPAASSAVSAGLPPGVAPTITLMARKGLWWLPAPSMELELGVRHLLGSEMWAGIMGLKLALHEGFHGWPIPELAARGAVSRLFNTPGFDLTITSLDFSISKRFGVAATLSISPYAGYQLLWVIADSGVIDARPDQASAQLDDPRYFTFLNQSNIFRHRAFGGARFNFYLASLLLELSYAFEGGDEAVVRIDPQLQTVAVDDRAGDQIGVTLSLAVEF